MASRPFILDELTWKTVRDTRYEVAVLPWGATEAHNYHLPYTTDNIQAEAVAARAAERAWERGAKVVVLPTVPFGVNTGQLDIPLCINMNPSTQWLVLRDVAMSMAVTYYLFARKWPQLWEKPWTYGPLYGVLLYGIMNYIVVPLSNANPGSRNLTWVLLSIAVHAFLIGTPCAVFARRAMLATRVTVTQVPVSV